MVLIRRVWPLPFVAASLVVAMTSWGVQPASAAQPQLVVSGGTAAGVPMALWQDQFNQLDAGDVAYSSMTSPSGLSAFSGATADVALSDLTYAASGLTPPGQPFQYVPVAEAGEGFQYNLVGVNGKQINNLVLTPH